MENAARRCQVMDGTNRLFRDDIKAARCRNNEQNTKVKQIELFHLCEIWRLLFCVRTASIASTSRYRTLLLIQTHIGEEFFLEEVAFILIVLCALAKKLRKGVVRVLVKRAYILLHSQYVLETRPDLDLTFSVEQDLTAAYIIMAHSFAMKVVKRAKNLLRKAL